MTKDFYGPKGYWILGTTIEMLKLPIEGLLPYCLEISEDGRNFGSKFTKMWIGDQLLITPLNGDIAKNLIESSEETVKGAAYNNIEMWLGDNLFTCKDNSWKSERKALLPIFHQTKFKDYVGSFNRESKIFTNVLENQAEKLVDLYPYIKRCALDIICNTCLNFDSKAQTDQNHKYVDAVSEMNHMIILFTMKPWLKLPIIFELSGWKKKFNECLRTLEEFTMKIIDERIGAMEYSKENLTENSSIVDKLLSNPFYTKPKIREFIDAFLFAGHDTITSALSWTIWCLACHEETQDEIYKETMMILSDSTSKEVTIGELNQCEYLDRAIRESLRLFPPAPVVQRKLKNDLELDGTILPKEANICVSPIVMHRNEQVWKNANKFDPNRFLSDPKISRSLYDYLPFFAGPRNCLGQKFAMIELKVVLLWLIRSYKISTPHDFEENIPLLEVILRPSLGVPVILEKR